MLKVGDKVRVIRNFQGPGWDFIIGHTGVVSSIEDYDCVRIDPPVTDGFMRGYIFSIREVELLDEGSLPLPG